MLLQVTSAYFCAGLITNNSNIVIETAPILHYMKNWHITEVIRYTIKKQWRIVCVQELIDQLRKLSGQEWVYNRIHDQWEDVDGQLWVTRVSQLIDEDKYSATPYCFIYGANGRSQHIGYGNNITFIPEWARKKTTSSIIDVKLPMVAPVLNWNKVTKSSPPANNEPILVYVPNTYTDCQIRIARRRVEIEELTEEAVNKSPYTDAWYDIFEDYIDDEDFRPTHWMPLPSPPGD